MIAGNERSDFLGQHPVRPLCGPAPQGTESHPKGAGGAAPRHRQGGQQVGDWKGVSRPEAAGAPGPGAECLPGGAPPGGAHPSPTLTKEEAGQAAVQAMEQSQKNTARRYLRMFQVVLWIGAGLYLVSLIPPLTFLGNLLWLDLFRSQGLGVIGSSDGPTVILTAGGPLIPYEAQTVLIVLALLTCAVMAVRVRRLERRLK